MVSTARYLVVIRALRGASAIGFVLFLALIGLYLFGRQGRPEAEAGDAAPVASEDGDYAVRGEGFEFALTRGDRVVFEIRGREQRSDRDGRVFLEDVRIAMQRGDGMYRLDGRSAVYDQGTQEARLDGDVVIVGPRGLQIETERLDLSDDGSQVRGREGVRFASGGELRGRADVLRVDLDRRDLFLAGSVAVFAGVDAKVPWSLETEELAVREDAASAVAKGGVVLRSGDNRLRAERLHLYFDARSHELEHARLLSGVLGVLATANRAGATDADGEEGSGSGGGSPLQLAATALEVRFDPSSGEPLAFDLRGLQRRPARVVQEQPDGSVATLTTVSLEGAFEQGNLARADLHGPLWLTQGASGRRGAERQVRASNGEARFDPVGGGIEGVTLVGEVAIQDADASATGERAYVDFRRGTFEIHGVPAHVEHPRGRLDAPRAVYRRDAGILEADGGVQAVMVEGGEALAPGLAAAGSDQPLRVESSEAIWEAEPSSVRFLGGVRAWQGENTLFAEQLRAEPDRGWMAASGGVRTLWHDPPAAEGEEPAAAGASGGEGEEDRPTGPLEITASEMTYSEEERLLVYTGGVKVVQDWTDLTCERMTAVLEQGGGTDEIECEREVKIVDSRNARTLEGDRALYRPKVPEVEVFGDPLTMTDGSGNKVEGGRHFVYDLERGTSRLSAKPAATP